MLKSHYFQESLPTLLTPTSIIVDWESLLVQHQPAGPGPTHVLWHMTKATDAAAWCVVICCPIVGILVLLAAAKGGMLMLEQVLLSSGSPLLLLILCSFLLHRNRTFQVLESIDSSQIQQLKQQQ